VDTKDEKHALPKFCKGSFSSREAVERSSAEWNVNTSKRFLAALPNTASKFQNELNSIAQTAGRGLICG
jgi:hypothetical protein